MTLLAETPVSPAANSGDVVVRSIRPEDAAAAASICYEAFGDINRRHGFPSDFPVPEMAAELIDMAIKAPFVWGVVAEVQGRIVGSNFLWEMDSISGVGPITVDPSAQKASGVGMGVGIGMGVGRKLMEAVLARAAEQKAPGVRLAQAAFNTTSMSLYTKLGFEIREPLTCLQGTVSKREIPGHTVRHATADDLSACADVCRRVHGHDRTNELAGAVAQGSALVVEQGSQIVGYSTVIGFFGHAVALTNDGLKALIAAAPEIAGPGLLLPSRNAEVFRWCLASGLRVVQPMTLMSIGLYNEPRGAFLPSILF